MNYPVWDLPSGGLLIAFVAVLHVFISHFAVGGGLFLVVSERRARRLRDDHLLGWVRHFSRFFILLTLVLGAITGVGIWFTIGLVHPQATSTLIQAFVWAWGVEWTFFFAEIAAALVYYYGWDRLPARTHEAVGWIYFANAWLSLVVIDGILAFMLTPGAWITTRSLWDGFFNPTYVPSLVARTCGAAGLAGLYAIAAAGWSRDALLKAKVARYAGLGWVLPMALAVPLSLAWYLAAASGAGVPVGEILGTSGQGMWALGQAVLGGGASGQPVTQRAALVTVAAAVVAVALVIALATVRRERFGRPASVLLLAAGLAIIGGAEWTREGLRKPYIIGGHMFVDGVRLPPPAGVPLPPPDEVARFGADRFTLDALNRDGVLASASWKRPAAAGPDASPVDQSADRGRELFRLLCRACHTLTGYVAVEPLVRGKSVVALDGLIDRLARPVDPAGQPADWDHPSLRLVSWRGRQMPPFAGTPDERRDLAVYLARVGGATADALATEALAAESARGGAGPTLFEEHCAACHGTEAQWPMSALIKGRTADAFHELIKRLPELNDIMPAFEGTDAERRALADHLATLGAGKGATR